MMKQNNEIYGYNAEENILLHPKIYEKKNKKSVKFEVELEHKSSLTWPKPSSYTDINHIGDGTPFPSFIIELIRKHKVQRILIQSNTQSSSNYIHDLKHHNNSCHYALNSQPSSIYFSNCKNMGPSGLSIHINFIHEANKHGSQNEIVNEFEKRFHSILRSVSGMRLVCAPLDVIRLSRYGHSTLSHSYSPSNANISSITEFYTQLPNEIGTFCGEAFHSSKSMILPCRDYTGIFASGPSPNILMGTDLGISMGLNNGSKRRSISIDIQVEALPKTDISKFDLTHGCFQSFSNQDKYGCRLTIAQNVQYSMTFPLKKKAKHDFTLSDILLGASLHNEKSKMNPVVPPTPNIQHSGMQVKKLHVCPLVNSSSIVTIIDNDYEAQFSYPPTDSYASLSNEMLSTTVTHDLLSLQNIKMKVPWVSISSIYETDSSNNSSTSIDSNQLETDTSKRIAIPEEWSIQRNVKPSFGVASTGLLTTVVRNGHTLCPSVVDVVDIYPTFAMKPIFHTLKMTIYEGNGSGQDDFTPQKQNQNAKKYIIPWNRISITHQKHTNDVTSLALSQVKLPKDSSLWITIQYEPVFLSLESFPSNPNNGFNIPSSIATLALQCNCNETLQCPTMYSASTSARLYSNSLVFMPPVPDMSMPFNVISLTCTVYAFIIGTLLNILMKKGSENVKNKYQKQEPESKLDKLKKKLNALKIKIKSKLFKGDGNVVENQKKTN